MLEVLTVWLATLLEPVFIVELKGTRFLERFFFVTVLIFYFFFSLHQSGQELAVRDSSSFVTGLCVGHTQWVRAACVSPSASVVRVCDLHSRLCRLVLARVWAIFLLHCSASFTGSLVCSVADQCKVLLVQSGVELVPP